MTRRPRKTAIVTGGGQGIGRCIVEHLLKAGMAVAAVDADPEAGEECERLCRGPRRRVRYFPADVGNEGEVADAVAAVKDWAGRIDYLVNNAGGGCGTGPVEDLAVEVWDRVLAGNLTGAFLMVKHTARELRRHRGAIVNIASTRARQSEPDTEAYSAAKGGLVALTHSLAVSLGDRVRVNCISPGWIEVGEWKKRGSRRTPKHSAADRRQHPVGRVGTPHDVAELVVYLLSEKAGFITGRDIVVDGGMSRKMIYVE